jgi:hypothetical protein
MVRAKKLGWYINGNLISQNAALMEAIMPGYKRRLKDEAGAMDQSAHITARRLTKHKNSLNQNKQGE